MTATICCALFGALAVLGAEASRAQPGQAQSTVALVSEYDAMVPGETAMLGLWFVMPETWHIYQVSQNDTGLEPMPEWSSDGGLEFGSIQWPAGHRFTQAGEILDHGYEGSVLLMVPVEVPSSATVGDSVTIRASVDWLECDAMMCVPGSTDVSLTLPVRVSSERGDDASAFDDARAAMGTPLRGDAGEPVSVTWEGTTMVVRASEGSVSFVPGEGSARVRDLFSAGASSEGELRLEFGSIGEPVIGWVRLESDDAVDGEAGASEVWQVRTRVGEAI